MNDKIMYGYVLGDFYARIPSTQAEYEKYFNCEKISFKDAQEAVYNGQKIPARFLSKDSREAVKELYRVATGSAEDIDCAGAMFMCPVSSQGVGVVVPLSEDENDVPFFINFSSLSYEEREAVVEARLGDGSPIIEVSIPGNVLEIIDMVYENIGEENMEIYDVLYQLTLDMGELSAIDKMMVALANIDEVGSVQEAETLDESDLDIEKGIQKKEMFLFSLDERMAHGMLDDR